MLSLVVVAVGVTGVVIVILPRLAALASLLIGLSVYVAVIGASLLLRWYRTDAATLIGLTRLVRGRTR